MAPRLWTIVCHAHTDGSLTVRVHVEGRLILPACESCQLDDALGYLDAVLVDFRENDRLSLRTQGTAGLSWKLDLGSPADAFSWLRAQLAASETSPGGDDASASAGRRTGRRAYVPA